MSKPESNSDANGEDELQLRTAGEIKEHDEDFRSIHYNLGNEIDWDKCFNYGKLKPRNAILFIHGLNPDAYIECKGEVPPNLRHDGIAVEFFHKVKHWIDVAESETVDNKTPAEWLAWADNKQLPVHSKFRAMVAEKTAPIDAMPKSKPVPRFAAQEAAILEEIRSRGHSPLALPKRLAGKNTVKADIRAMLCSSRKELFQSTGVFNKAWERLRSRREIQERM